jgi:hypothetical protein
MTKPRLTSTPRAKPAQALQRGLTIACTLFLLVAVAGRAQAPFVRTVIVNSGGSATANGTALINALAGITTNSSTNPWLIKIEPGIFDLGGSSLILKDYVDMEGSGPGVTTITSSQPRGAGNVAAINAPAGVHAEVRELTIQNTSSDAIGFAYTSSNPSLYRINIVIPNGAVSTMGILGNGNPTITKTNIQLSSSNNTSQGIYVAGNPVIKDVTVTIQNTSVVVASYGILLVGGSATIDGAVVTISGAQSNYGMLAQSSSPTVTHSSFTVTTVGGGAAEGIKMFFSGCTLQDLKISVVGGGDSYGIVLDGGDRGNVTAVVRRVSISAAGATGQNNGVYVDEEENATLREIDVQASGGEQASAVFADYANGLSNFQTLTITDSNLQASGGTTNFGINVSGVNDTLAIVRTTAAASGGTSYGLSDSASPNTYRIDHSQISGGTGSVHLVNIFNAGASQLSGTVSPAPGVCVDSYNGSYTALSTTCH